MPYYRKDIFKKIYHYNKLVVELPKTFNNCVRLLDRQKWTLGEGDRGIVNNNYNNHITLSSIIIDIFN